jgi:adenine-specific DNA-methyltransferase
VWAVMDEVFGWDNFLGLITFTKTGGQTDDRLAGVADYILWYSRNVEAAKFRQLYRTNIVGADGGTKYTELELATGERVPLNAFLNKHHELPSDSRVYRKDTITSQSPGTRYNVVYEGRVYRPEPGYWKTDEPRMANLLKARRVEPTSNKLAYVQYFDDFAVFAMNNVWTDLGGVQSRADPKIYVVQTAASVIERCILMTTDPGDIVLDPSCGSGTTAYVAEQWGRRWITIDTSRVALALARARIMGARYPYYLLADSPGGQLKEAEITRSTPSIQPTRGDIRQGFVYERVPHITLKSIANNAEIDVIWEQWQTKLEPLREALNRELKQSWQEWEIPREADGAWSGRAKQLHADWRQACIARQKEIDASIAAKAEFEYLYDKPYEDKRKVRVAGPFTVESLSPYRVLGADENDELIDGVAESTGVYGKDRSFVQMILEHLKTAGVQQAHKEDKITFTSLTPWPGDLVCAEGRYIEGDAESGREKRVAIFIGPEFGTVSRPDLVLAAREAGDANFDVLIACAFNYDAHSSEFNKLGRIPVLKARMNADLHMADDLKNTGKGNLFVIFGEPDIDIFPAEDGKIQVKINGVDVFHPQTGEVRSDGAEGIACWFIDTDYNEESFFVRHAYFLGANDPYKSLKTTLKAEINEEAWDTLNRDTSRPFDKPTSGRIAVKVINHLGDEVMKVFQVR